MSWGGEGKGSGWNCQDCGCYNHHTNLACVNCFYGQKGWGSHQNKGWTGKGSPQKGKWNQSKGKDLPVYYSGYWSKG
eukprot:7914688-Heterocapsa_arctica.AAC.1